ncbi:DUF6268 family outer membrane beta-barrel protein [Ulvibacterium marinum]|uniref:DUF6268 family outer membrane beta-barrel protein n=1 Tax=Ulvibacterium marinum TaxID=2419782 RepID=UPI00249446A6|nr:DUF6268 family outer membrane beta-barrel protein [Ulvibacterium marinum]
MIITAHRNPIYCQESQDYFEGVFEYGLIPSLGDTNLEKYVFSLNAIKNLNSGKLELGLDYLAHTFSFYNSSAILGTDSYDKTHTVQPEIGYHQNFGSKWAISVSAAPMLSSNFKNGLNNEDFIFNWSALVSKKWGKGDFPVSLTMGLGRGIILGEPGLFPILSFQGKITPKWRYILGFPYSKVAYKIDEKHSLSSKAIVSGIYVNNSETVSVNGLDNLEHTKLTYNGIDLGLEYNYHMSSGFIAVIRTGFTMANNLKVLDSNDNPLFDFEINSSPYVVMGLKYSLNFTNKSRK